MNTLDFSFIFTLKVPPFIEEIPSEYFISFLCVKLKSQGARVISASSDEIIIQKNKLFNESFNKLSIKLYYDLQSYIKARKNISMLIDFLHKLTQSASIKWVDLSAWDNERLHFNIKIRTVVSGKIPLYCEKLIVMLNELFKPKKVIYADQLIDICEPKIFNPSENSFNSYKSKLSKEAHTYVAPFLYSPANAKTTPSRLRTTSNFDESKNAILSASQNSLFTKPSEPRHTWSGKIKPYAGTEFPRIYPDSDKEIIFYYIDHSQLRKKKGWWNICNLLFQWPHMLSFVKMQRV